MKALIQIILTSLCLAFLPASLLAQEESEATQMVITKNDGTQYMGTVVSMDEREILIETKDLGSFYIPRQKGLPQ